nr:glutamine synthetase nodule isozyme-like [Populus alba]
MLNGLVVGLLVAILVLGDHTTVVLVLTKPSALLMHSRRDACMPWKFQVGPSVRISVGDELWAAARITEVAGVVLSFDPKPTPEIGLLFVKIGKERGHTKITGSNFAMSMRNEGGCEVIKKAIEKLGFANRKASICVGRDIEKEGKGYYEDIMPASNMDLYVATSMIVETTILWKP